MTDLILDAIRQVVQDTMREELANLAPPTPVESGLPELLTAEQAAAATGLSIPTLARQRAAGEGIPFQRYGRSIRYRRDDVLTYGS